MSTIELFCATCAAVTRYEKPPCLDGHGAECPEWCCVACGAAILIGGAPVPVPAVPAPAGALVARRSGPAGRTAAGVPELAVATATAG